MPNLANGEQENGEMLRTTLLRDLASGIDCTTLATPILPLHEKMPTVAT